MEDQKLKRGKAIYRNNPSIPDAIATMKTGTKRISSPIKSDTELIVSNPKSGEVYSGIGLGFHKRVKVDKEEFVKLYIKGVSAFTGLSKAGARVLEMVISESKKYIGKDTIFLSTIRAKEIFDIPKATYQRGLKELVETEILFNTLETNIYFINVNYMFNGDRLAFLQTYEIDNSIEISSYEIENPNQQQLPFDGYIIT